MGSQGRTSLVPLYLNTAQPPEVIQEVFYRLKAGQSCNVIIPISLLATSTATKRAQQAHRHNEGGQRAQNGGCGALTCDPALSRNRPLDSETHNGFLGTAR